MTGSTQSASRAITGPTPAGTLGVTTREITAASPITTAIARPLIIGMSKAEVFVNPNDRTLW